MAITRDENIVLATKQRFARQILNFDKVHGVGVSLKRRRGSATDLPAIMVTVEQKLPPRLIKSGERIPSTLPAFDIAGMPLPNLEVAVDVEEGGPYFLAAGKNVKKTRPLKPGFSFGRIGGGNGTIGAKLIDLNLVPGQRKRNPKQADWDGFFDTSEMELPADFPEFFLSCAHVFTLEPLETHEIIQQSGDDGGKKPAIGKLVRWTPVPQVEFAYVQNGRNLRYHSSYEDVVAVRAVGTRVSAEIEGIGAPTGQRNITFLDLRAGQPAVTVQKCGRTTGVTKATLKATSYDVEVGINLGGFQLLSVMLRDQILAVGKGVVAAPGDSGSLILDDKRKAAGLLVGASGKEMVFTPMVRVLMALNYPFTTFAKTAKGEPKRYFVLAGA